MKRTVKIFLVSFFLSLCLSAAIPPSPPQADLVLRHAKIYTMDAARSWAESVAIRGGRLLYVGSDSGVERWIGPSTKVEDLAGQFVLPSFIDAHVHPLEAGIALQQIDLSDMKTKDEIIAAIDKYAQQHPNLSWIMGGGWQLPVFPQANPQKEWLDAVV